MRNIFNNKHGMNIVGQGGKIILFTLPSLVAAILAQKYLPHIAALPWDGNFLRLVGVAWLVPGILLWGTAIVQLLTDFPRGKLVTTGAYGVVRNPIYSSVTFFVLPAVSLITLTWVYVVASIFLYAGVMIFIGKEEKKLVNTFGKEYESYLARVDRMIPWLKRKRIDSKNVMVNRG